MATLTYWTARCMTDANCYSIIAKTRKEVAAQLAALGYAPNKEGEYCKVYAEGLGEIPEYDAIEKRMIHYRDAFDLFDIVTGEGGGR